MVNPINEKRIKKSGKEEEMRKFAVELEIEVSEKAWKDGDMSIEDYIVQELGWTMRAYANLRIKEIREVKAQK